MFLAAACGSTAPRVEDDPLPFRGGIAADEPRAALAAREVLEKGGSAADAAVALFFALAVTRPSAASLGAGGVCLAFEPRLKRIQAIDFTAPPAPPGAGDAVAPPSAVRGMAALHGGFGRLRWEQLVAPAEAMARFGVPVSRAFAADLAAAGAELAQDPEARAIFLRADGAPVGEGDMIRQPDLAETLGRLRAEGPGELYRGALAQRYVDSVAAAGGALDIAELQGFTPRAQEPITLRLGSRRVHFAPSFDTMGPYQALLWTLLTEAGDLRRGSEGEQARLVAESAAHAYAAYRVAASGDPAAFSAWLADRSLPDLPETHPGAAAPAEPDVSGTGFVVADARGAGVACGLAMGRPFGFGRIAPGTGVFPAVRRPAGSEATALSPILVMNPNTQILILAAAGSGPGAPTSVTELAVRTVTGGEPLAAAMSGPRAENRGWPDSPVAEPAAAGALAAGGRPVRTVAALGRLNALFCARGLPDNPESCELRTDRRGLGLDTRIGK
mgnify:CR=1 FL=1